MQTDAQLESGVACNARHKGENGREKRRNASRSMVMREDQRTRERMRQKREMMGEDVRR
jgi:hypothetical protein